MTNTWKKGKKKSQNYHDNDRSFYLQHIKKYPRSHILTLMVNSCDTLYCKITGFPLDMTTSAIKHMINREQHQV